MVNVTNATKGKKPPPKRVINAKTTPLLRAQQLFEDDRKPICFESSCSSYSAAAKLDIISPGFAYEDSDGYARFRLFRLGLLLKPAVHDITAMLRRSRTDEKARESLYALVYADLRRIAGYRIASSRPGETLSVTSLVNEAYLKLTDGAPQQWNDRQHFLRVAAKVMRQITIDYVRAKLAGKRGSGEALYSLDSLQLPAPEKPELVLALDEALQQLATEHPRLVQVVECRFYAGLTIPEAATALESSERTVERDWARAREWLKDYLS